MNQTQYIGRFAPSPTGELHFGSLVSAVGSYLQARAHHQGRWLIRVEDIDPPREVPGSAGRILETLAGFGMKPDRPVLFQSQRLHAYRSAWERLLDRGMAYYCRCSRKMLTAGAPYPGTCRNAGLGPKDVYRVRFRVPSGRVVFTDAVMGAVSQDLGNEVGDFVIRRADGLPAYQLAVVVDDAFQSVTEVVRGADLLQSTPRQIALQHALGLSPPAYCHLPLATTPDGSKLSKRLQSDPVGSMPPVSALRQALEFLGHKPPPNLDLEQLWAWAGEHWDLARVPRQAATPVALRC